MQKQQTRIITREPAPPAGSNAGTTVQTTQKRRGRPRKQESFANWMARIDAEVDAVARKMERQPPTYAWLHPAQKRIVEMLNEHMRSLPSIGPSEDECQKPEYLLVKTFLVGFYERKYPNWVRLPGNTSRYINDIPNGEGKDFL
jgi:hypothetical protein